MKLKAVNGKAGRSSRLRSGAAVAALIGAGALAPASAAHAGSNEPPTIAGLYCNSWGANQFFCSMSIQGGISPYQSNWSGVANVSSFGSHGQDYTLGTCTTQGVTTQVAVTVIDGYGYSAEASFSFPCA